MKEPGARRVISTLTNVPALTGNRSSGDADRENVTQEDETVVDAEQGNSALTLR